MNTKTNATSVLTKDYKNKPPLGDLRKQTQSNPICSGSNAKNRTLHVVFGLPDEDVWFCVFWVFGCLIVPFVNGRLVRDDVYNADK